jgi:hypothetical protein
MAKIRNFVLSAELTEELAEAAKELPDDLLLVWGRECLPGGFTRAEAIRERLVARLRSDAAIDPRLAGLLALGLYGRETIAAFSLPALQQLFDPLSVLLGRESVLLGLLLDPREHVHKWATEIAARPAPPPMPEEEQIAVDYVFQFLDEKVLSVLPPPPPAPANQDAPPPPGLLDKLTKAALDDLSQKIEAQRKTIERLNNELHQQKQRHLAKLKQEAETAEREQKAIRAELTHAQTQAGKLAQEKQALEVKFKDLSERVQSAVATGIREQTSALVRKWLEGPLKVEAAAQAGDGGALVERAQQALEAQARRDRHSANRVELEHRLDDLRGVRQRLAAALQNALTPLAELKPLLAEVEAEVARLSELLTGAAPVTDLAARLLGAINSAQTWEEVSASSRLVDQLAEQGLLPASDTRAIYNSIQRKFSLLEETGRRKNAEVGDSGWSLRDMLYRNKSALLLLDGHNLLFGLTDIFSPDYENNYPRGKARQRLVNMIGKLVRARPNIQAKICFDGAQGGAVKVAPNLEVLYSGGTGKDRADQLIVSQLQFKDLKSLDQKVFVVTDDREVRRGILQTGATFVPANLFAVFLKDFECLG